MLPTAKHTDSFVLCSLCSEENVKKTSVGMLRGSGLLLLRHLIIIIIIIIIITTIYYHLK